MQAATQELSFADRLVQWQAVHGRHDLPWQRSRDAYPVWLSEVMLQQTQVATVIPYFERFLGEFPTLKDLAQAPVEAVMALWSGLGYYSRARNLHRCAGIVMLSHGGQFPVERDELIKLPGIGRSTAAAIRVFAHDQKDAILDGNVKRVFCRHFAVHGVPDSPPIMRLLWTLAERELASEELVRYTQGLMDLGATVCTRAKPRCDLCPVASTCGAHQQSLIAELPTRRKRAALPQRQITVLVLRSMDDEVLMLLRPDTGIWGGLLSLPESTLEPSSSMSEHLDQAGLSHVVQLLETGQSPGQSSGQLLTPIDHTFTHFKLRLTPVIATVSGLSNRVSDHLGGPRLVALNAMQAAPLPRPIKTLLTGLALTPGR